MTSVAGSKRAPLSDHRVGAGRTLPDIAELLDEVGGAGSEGPEVEEDGDEDPQARYRRIGSVVRLDELPRGETLVLDFVDTWEDPYYGGLTGLSVLIADGSKCRRAGHGVVREFVLPVEQLFAKPADINVEGHTGDPRTLDKLVDGENVTCVDTHMWLVPFTVGAAHLLQLDLGASKHIAGVGVRHLPSIASLSVQRASSNCALLFVFCGCGCGFFVGRQLRVWNYNKNEEDTRRGMRHATLKIDGHAFGDTVCVAVTPPTECSTSC